MTTAFAFSALVWLLSFAVALYYLVRLQEWRIGVVASVVAIVALGELAALTAGGTTRTAIGGATAAEITAVVVSVITLFAVFVFANTLKRARRATGAAERADAELRARGHASAGGDGRDVVAGLERDLGEVEVQVFHDANLPECGLVHVVYDGILVGLGFCGLGELVNAVGVA